MELSLLRRRYSMKCNIIDYFFCVTRISGPYQIYRIHSINSRPLLFSRRPADAKFFLEFNLTRISRVFQNDYPLFTIIQISVTKVTFRKDFNYNNYILDGYENFTKSSQRMLSVLYLAKVNNISVPRSIQ